MGVQDFSDLVRLAPEGKLQDESLRFKIKSAVVLQNQMRMEEARRKEERIREEAKKNLLRIKRKKERRKREEEVIGVDKEKPVVTMKDLKIMGIGVKEKETNDGLVGQLVGGEKEESLDKKSDVDGINKEEVEKEKDESNSDIKDSESKTTIDEIDEKETQSEKESLNSEKNEQESLSTSKSENTEKQPPTDLENPIKYDIKQPIIDQEKLDKNLKSVHEEMISAINTPHPQPEEQDLHSVWDVDPLTYQDPLLSDENPTFCLKSLSISYALAKINKQKKPEDFNLQYDSLFDDSISVSAENDCLFGEFLRIVKVKKEDLQNARPTFVSQKSVNRDENEKEKANEDLQDFLFLMLLENDKSMLVFGSDSSKERLGKAPVENNLDMTSNDTMINFANMKIGKNAFWQIAQNFDGSYKISNYLEKYTLNVFHIDPGTFE